MRKCGLVIIIFLHRAAIQTMELRSCRLKMRICFRGEVQLIPRMLLQGAEGRTRQTVIYYYSGRVSSNLVNYYTYTLEKKAIQAGHVSDNSSFLPVVTSLYLTDRETLRDSLNRKRNGLHKSIKDF